MRLEINNIRWRNFLSFGSKWQEVEFLYGLNLILGLDSAKDRSNASGKSSFLETVPFALFGKVNRNINKDGIINWRNRKNCEVMIEFSKNDDEYLIYRALKPDKLSVTKNGEDLPIDSDKRIFQKNLEEEILGIDFATFMSLIYTNINSTVPVLTMKTPEKRKFLERIFNLQLFNKVNEKANEKIRSLDKRSHDLKMNKEFNEKTIKDAHTKISDLQKRMGELSSSKSELEEAKEQLEKVEERYLSDKQEFERLKEKISENTELEGYYSTLLAKIQNKWANLSGKAQTLEKQVDMDSVKRGLAEIKQLQNTRDGYGDPKKIEEALKELDAEREKFAVERDGHILRRVDYEKEVASSEALISQDEEHLQTMEEKDECPFCGEKITDEKIADLKRKLKINRAKLTRSKNGRRDALSLEGTLQKEINARIDSKTKMKETLMTIIRLDGDINEKKAALKSLDVKAIKKKAKRYWRAVERLDEIGNIYATKIELANGIIKAAQEDQETYAIRIDGVDLLRKQIEGLSTKVENEEKMKISFEEMIESEGAKIVTLSEENKNSKKEVEKYELLEDYMRYVKTCCKDDNIKQFIISSNMPHLNRKTNEYLSEVGHGFYVTIDRWLEATIKGPGITGASYGNLSGGEARGIDISLQMALLDHARLKAGLFPDMLITDELLDSSIDSYGLDRVMKIIKGKQLKDNLKIYLVSHRKEVDDVDVDRTYLVEKTGGYSHITLQ